MINNDRSDATNYNFNGENFKVGFTINNNRIDKLFNRIHIRDIKKDETS